MLPFTFTRFAFIFLSLSLCILLCFRFRFADDMILFLFPVVFSALCSLLCLVPHVTVLRPFVLLSVILFAVSSGIPAYLPSCFNF